jgi:hypothetical protein
MGKRDGLGFLRDGVRVWGLSIGHTQLSLGGGTYLIVSNVVHALLLTYLLTLAAPILIIILFSEMLRFSKKNLKNKKNFFLKEIIEFLKMI